MHPLRSIALVTLAASLSLSGADAQANGRYPSAQFFVVGEGANRGRIAIVTTFGIVFSTDGGRRWGWACEDAIGYTGTYDPAIAMGSDGSLIAGLPDGVSRTAGRDWCRWSRPASFASEPVTDLTSTGTAVLAAVTPPASMQYVSRSDDDGQTWTRGWTRPEFYAHTIDVAPSRASRVYATGWVRGARPAMFRSDDGGGFFSEVTQNFSGGYIAFIAWVDPLAPDRLLVRADLDPAGALLLLSDDAGASFRTLFRAGSPLIGVAAAPGARALWASSTALTERIQRSTDGGSSWAPVTSTLRPRSMRFVDETLFATANELSTGFSFACSRDQGDSWTPMLVLSELIGPDVCPEGSPVRAMCAPLWPALRMQLASIPRPPSAPRGTCDEPRSDGGAPTDVPSWDAADAPRDVPDVPVGSPDAGAAGDVSTDAVVERVDADAAPASPPLRAGGGCTCRVRDRSRTEREGVLSLLLAAGGTVLAGRGRGRPSRKPARGPRNGTEGDR
jgi:hypothetical protein